MLSITLYGQEPPLAVAPLHLALAAAWGIENYDSASGGPAFNATYEFRVRKYLALEAGAYNTLVTAYQGSFGQITTCTPFDPATFASVCTSSGFISTTFRSSARDTISAAATCLYLRSEGLRYPETAEVTGIISSSVNEFPRRAIARLAEAAATNG